MNIWFRLTTNKTPKLHIIGPLWEKSTTDQLIPPNTYNYAENDFMAWCCHVIWDMDDILNKEWNYHIIIDEVPTQLNSMLAQVKVCWRCHQTISWANIDSSVRSSDINLWAISQEIPLPSNTEISWNIAYLKHNLNLPEPIKLMRGFN